jgi:hypothetical protein
MRARVSHNIAFRYRSRAIGYRPEATSRRQARKTVATDKSGQIERRAGVACPMGCAQGTGNGKSQKWREKAIVHVTIEDIGGSCPAVTSSLCGQCLVPAVSGIPPRSGAAPLGFSRKQDGNSISPSTLEISNHISAALSPPRNLPLLCRDVKRADTGSAEYLLQATLIATDVVLLLSPYFVGKG